MATHLSVPTDVLGFIRPYLPKGWNARTDVFEHRMSLRVTLWIDLGETEWLARFGAQEKVQWMSELLRDALIGTFDRWRGAQPMPDCYWRQ